jgi:hypothetical protein
LTTTIGRRLIATGKWLRSLFHHTDVDREWVCDREFNIGIAKRGGSTGLHFFCFQNTKVGRIITVMFLANCNFLNRKL